MKKIILKSIMCALLLGLAWSCSNESDVNIKQSSEKNVLSKDNSIWDGVIGIEREGEYVIAVDEQELIAAFEDIAEQQLGKAVKLSTVEIVLQTATNDPSSQSYVVIAGTEDIGGDSYSVGRMLTMSAGKLYISSGIAGKSTGCDGCARGCLLKYYNIDGHYVPYCDSAGCGRYCFKFETD